uniref:Uncharacterized protein n=1 Tax=Panagrolaimus sp. JU765 TaxID=591449 RepID=A0AC34Q2A8_9BILA
MGEAGKELVIEIPMEEGEPLGAILSDKLVVIKVQAGTLAEDGRSDYQSQQHSDTFAPPVARLSIIRDEKKAEELEAKVHIPPKGKWH